MMNRDIIVVTRVDRFSIFSSIFVTRVSKTVHLAPDSLNPKDLVAFFKTWEVRGILEVII
jgi:hypothetical protein